jgi:hypothetical protein
MGLWDTLRLLNIVILNAPEYEDESLNPMN